jgi:beta-lactamase class A
VYTEERFREGAGVLRRLPFGSVINEADMLDYTVRVSDNAAFRMLLAAYGADGFKDWVAEKGGRTQHLHNITWAHMTVNDAAFFTRLMHEYIQTDGERNAAFEQSLLESIFPYIHTAHPLAHKHGNWDDALHDMGIVYAPSPYILVIFTDMGCSEIWPGAAERAVFREISQKMEEANERVVSVWLNRVR